jgi:hypothetical protein
MIDFSVTTLECTVEQDVCDLYATDCIGDVTNG